jgi:NADH-quinone oxidoreductase subunit L
MILAVGAGDIVGGLFHLLSHAFFKGLLFMAAGCVIQALAEEHNIFRMGNLHRLMPGVSWAFLAGSLCLSAFPLLGGFFSKDRILLATFLHHDPIYWAFWFIAALAALLTPFYSLRVYLLVFQGREDGRRAEEVLPIPRLMVWVLWPLVLLALGDGVLNLPGGYGKNFLGYFLAGVPGARPDLGAPPRLEWVMGSGSASLVLLISLLTYLFYRRPRMIGWPALSAACLNGFYLDRLYREVIANPYQRLAGVLWQGVDENGLDRGFEQVGRSFGLLSRIFGLSSTGRLSTYLTMLFLGLTVMFLVLAATWKW